MTRRKKNIITIKPRNYFHSDFIVWLFISIVLLFFIMDILSFLYKFILFAFVFVLFYFAFIEIDKRVKEKMTAEDFRKLEGFKRFAFINIINLYFWILGIVFILFGFVLILVFPDFVIYSSLSGILSILAIILLAFGSLVVIAGFFTKALKEEFETFSKFSKYLKPLGSVIIVGGLFFLILSLLSENPFILNFIFYPLLILGCIFILIEAIYKKNKNSIFLLGLILSILILSFIFDLFNSGFILRKFSISFTQINFKSILRKPSYILLILERIFFIFLISLSFYFSLNYPILKRKENKNKKEYLKIFISLFLFLWIGVLIIIIMIL